MSRFTDAISFLGESQEEAREKAQAWISKKQLVLDAHDPDAVATYSRGYYIATVLYTPSDYLAVLADAVTVAEEAKAERDSLRSGTLQQLLEKPIAYFLAVAEVASRAQECLAAGYSKDRIIAITGIEMFEQANARRKDDD